jgi:hypothetical protein
MCLCVVWLLSLVEIRVRTDAAVEFSQDPVLVTRSTRVRVERADAESVKSFSLAAAITTAAHSTFGGTEWARVAILCHRGAH